MSSYFINLRSGCYGAVSITEGQVLVQQTDPGARALAPVARQQIRNDGD